MKTKELMIGDFITLADSLQDDGGPLVFKVVALDNPCEGDALMLLKGEEACDEMEIDDEWSGIPITPEILEKNGFEIVSARDDNAGTMEKYFYPRIGYVYRFSNGEWEVDLIGYGRGFSGAAKYRGVISYVHELQHAFRILGIEKEVVL